MCVEGYLSPEPSKRLGDTSLITLRWGRSFENDIHSSAFNQNCSADRCLNEYSKSLAPEFQITGASEKWQAKHLIGVYNSTAHFWVACLFVCLFGFLTSSPTTRLYRGRAPRQSVWQFYVLPHMRQSWETMTFVWVARLSSKDSYLNA